MGYQCKANKQRTNHYGNYEIDQSDSIVIPFDSHVREKQIVKCQHTVTLQCHVFWCETSYQEQMYIEFRLTLNMKSADA